jgi:hypothetical protein
MRNHWGAGEFAIEIEMTRLLTLRTQVGGCGVPDDFPLATAWAHLLTRLADGPDQVHKRAIARHELRKYHDQAPTTDASTATAMTD